jgi:hypothetical protein
MQLTITIPNFNIPDQKRDENGTLLLNTLKNSKNNTQSIISEHYDKRYEDVFTLENIINVVLENGWKPVDLAECVGQKQKKYRSKRFVNSKLHIADKAKVQMWGRKT